MAAPTVGSTWSPNDSYILKVTRVVTNSNTCYAQIYAKTKTLTSYATIPNYYTNSSNNYRYYIEDVTGCFQNCTKMTTIPSISTNLTRITDFTKMFYGCTSLTNTTNFFSWLHSVWSSDKIYNFVTTFCKCSKITTIPDVLPYGITISSMASCFCGCTKLQRLPIKTSDDPRYDMKCFFGYHNADSKVEEEHRQVTVYNMTSCFQGCTSLKIWPVPLPQGITNLTYCFYGCTSMEFYNFYDDKFNVPSTVTNMSYTFWKCKSIEQVGYINAIPPSNETWALQTLEGCFYGCENLTHGLCLRSNNSEAPYLSNIVSMYENCTSATLEDIGSLSAITYSAVDATCLFAGSDIFNSIDFNSFRQDFPNIYCAESMFSGCESLSLIENFDKFEIEKGGNMFNGCSFLDMAGQTIKLPESLIDISHLFQGIGVGFNIEVEPGWTQRSTVTPIPENVFPQISENFYLLYNSDSTTETFLQELANSYNNVHYSGDDLLAPTINFNLLRVNSINSEIEDRKGSYVYINTTVNYPQKNIPYGYSYEYFDDTTKIDNTYMIIQHGWSNYNHTNNKDWGQLSDELSHTISVSYMAVLKDENEQEVPNTYKSSEEISQTLASAFALLDFYPGGKGMAIGHYADKNGLDITYPTMIGEGLSTPLTNGEIDIEKNQLVIGKYNKIVPNAAFIIGNGTADNRHNIMEVSTNGDLITASMVGQIIMYAGPIIQTITNNIITSTAPAGYLLCDGSIVLIESYPELFAVLGTTYGGDGTDTFGLPDFRGRVGIGTGNGTATGHTDHALGTKGGNENQIIPYHRHSVSAVTDGITGGSHDHGSGTFATSSNGSHAHEPSNTGYQFLTVNATGASVGRHTVGTSGTTDHEYIWSESALGRYGATESTGAHTHDVTGTSGTRTHTHNLPSHNTEYTPSTDNRTGANMQPYIGINYIICTGKLF